MSNDVSDEKTVSQNIYLLKLEIDDKNWVTVAVNITTKVKDVVAKVLKRPNIARSTLCIVYNGASPLDAEENLYELMKLDPSGDNIFIVLIPDDGTHEHRQAIYELFPDYVKRYKPWGLFQKSKEVKVRNYKYNHRNRKTTKQFANDLHQFVSADVDDLNGIVFDMKTNEETAKTNYANRVSKYQKRSDLRRGTITQLKKDLDLQLQSNKCNKYKVDLTLQENINTNSGHSNSGAEKSIESNEANNNNNNNMQWLQYLNNFRQQLCEEMLDWNVIEADIPWPNDDTDDSGYMYERTLLCQMQKWMRMYGMPALRTQQDVNILKNELLKVTEEADQLDEEVVQVTQQLFNLENEKNELQLKLNLLNNYKRSSLLQSKSFSSYNKPLPELELKHDINNKHSKSQTLTTLTTFTTDELYNDNETNSDQINELQRKCNALQESNISMKKEIIKYKILQKTSYRL